MNNKKKIILSVLVALLLLAIGVTYAFFTYESGTKSDIVTGQIYMNYEETSTISLTGVFPETKAQALARQDENGVFEFTITGRNTSKYPVYYEIDLLEGGVITGKTEQSTKILPEHVMIYLEKDGVPVIEGKTYADWNNKPIYVETVPAGTTSNIEHKYTLRMWISDKITISDTDPNADYTTSEWNDAYTSLKVRVVGDFEEKVVETDASCFEYKVGAPYGYIAYDFDGETRYYELNTSEESVNVCKEYMMWYEGSDYSDAQDGYQSFCEGTGTLGGNTFALVISSGYFYSDEVYYFVENSVLEEVEEVPQVLEITDYDISCGTDVVIPSYIEGLPVATITGEYVMTSGGLYGGAFLGKGIKSVKLPDTLQNIDALTFYGNNLTEVIIPDSVTHIGQRAFWGNYLSTIVLGKNVSVIDILAFDLLNSNKVIVNHIETIINKSRNAFNWKNILDYNNLVTVQDPGVVATGTYVYYDGDKEQEIQITSE